MSKVSDLQAEIETLQAEKKRLIELVRDGHKRANKHFKVGKETSKMLEDYRTRFDKLLADTTAANGQLISYQARMGTFMQILLVKLQVYLDSLRAANQGTNELDKYYLAGYIEAALFTTDLFDKALNTDENLIEYVKIDQPLPPNPGNIH